MSAGTRTRERTGTLSVVLRDVFGGSVSPDARNRAVLLYPTFEVPMRRGKKRIGALLPLLCCLVVTYSWAPPELGELLLKEIVLLLKGAVHAHNQ